MARRSREDSPGSYHHVMNRALARRPLFEDGDDIRYFLSRLAREVRRGRIEILAWCVMTTHFHLLVRSPRGEMSEAMGLAQNEFVRFFNRRHRRDGSLMRGRYRSKCVDSLAYRRALVRYIDANPVMARIVSHPWRYTWCSARQYVGGECPPWLATDWIAEEVAAGRHAEKPFGDAYASTFHARSPEADRGLVEARTRCAIAGADDLDMLVDAAPERVRMWMRRKARVADGCEIGLPVCDELSVLRAVAARRALGVDRRRPGRGLAADPLTVIEIGLLRSLTGATWDRIAERTGKSRTSVQRTAALHAKWIEEDETAAAITTELTCELLRAYGGGTISPTSADDSHRTATG